MEAAAVAELKRLNLNDFSPAKAVYRLYRPPADRAHKDELNMNVMH